MKWFTNWSIRPYFRWKEFWIGFRYQRTVQNLFIGIPMLGIKIHKHYWFAQDHNSLRLFCGFCADERQGVLRFE